MGSIDTAFERYLESLGGFFWPMLNIVHPVFLGIPNTDPTPFEEGSIPPRMSTVSKGVAPRSSKFHSPGVKPAKIKSRLYYAKPILSKF